MHLATSALALVATTTLRTASAAGTNGTEPECVDLPDLRTLLETAFPTWNVDENGERTEGGGKWAPSYYTKKYDGMDPALGGYPTDIDVGYPFYYPAPFLGQPGAGTPHHCPEDAPVDIKIQTCPKVETDSDSGPLGPGHVPPPHSLAAVRQALKDCKDDFASWFDYDQHGCIVTPSALLGLVRRYYPRDPATGVVVYPPPTDPETMSYYELEYPSPQGGPHWCSEEFIAADQWADFCPYVFEGEDAGAYQHPHISLAAVQQYLANMIMPDKCGAEWTPPKGVYPEPSNLDTSIVFSEMESDDLDAQPKVPYNWPETSDRKRKGPLGVFPLYLVIQDDATCTYDAVAAASGTSSSESRLLHGSIGLTVAATLVLFLASSNRP